MIATTTTKEDIFLSGTAIICIRFFLNIYIYIYIYIHIYIIICFNKIRNVQYVLVLYYLNQFVIITLVL
jgi:hypothetical protein